MSSNIEENQEQFKPRLEPYLETSFNHFFLNLKS
jgi:hypothetical protein